jgi:hypothetical protein
MGKYDKYYENTYYGQAEAPDTGEADIKSKAKAEAFKAKKGPSKVHMGGFAVGAAIDTVVNMKSGDDFGTAAVKGAFTGMLWTTAPMLMGAMELGKAIPAAYEGYYNWKREKEQWWNQQFRPNFGGNYQDTRKALTMRQAAVEAIQGSKMNARSALGGEAKLIASRW